MSIPVENSISEIKNSVIAADEQSPADSGFYWAAADGVRVLKCRALMDAGFENGFSTRLGGVSPFPAGDLNLAGFSEDSNENIQENRRRFLKAFAGERTLATVWQVHGSDIKVVRNADNAAESDEKFDAVASDLPNLLAAVKTADCVPVLLGDTRRRAYAAVHAGWRGTVASIAAKALDVMKNEFGTDAKDLIAAIGPAACVRNYEIGEDVIEQFAANFPGWKDYFTPTRPGHALVDLHKANRDQLIEAGVSDADIYTAPFCTMESTDLFFSYRKEKQLHGKTGRLLSVIGQL